MDPLEDNFLKYFTKGAPIKVENVLNIDLKEHLKSPYLWTTIVAGLGLAYYFLTSDDEIGIGAADVFENSNGVENFSQYNYINHDVVPPPQPQQNNHHHHHNHNNHNHLHNHIQQTTTTTTTTTTTSSSSYSPITLPPPSNVQHVKLKNKNGEPLPLEEQNLLLLKENSSLRGENRDLRVWVSNQINNINDRMEKMQGDLEREKFCHICEENEKQVCWRECGHRLCARCATLIKKSSHPQCSICRKIVTDFYLAWNT
ncbi:hypothetical protein RB653_006542 [Dictyostelium firmibasis]|uniref:RING-type domain-containing protein n=1 Tax=Dictyostelium firmibasis TaxID=79012 RepID=A0AAN7TMA9_9MYCE